MNPDATTATLAPLLPRWMESAGAMLGMQALVRSCCTTCDTLLRVDLEDMVARHGAGYSLIDRLDRCRIVGCEGTAYYLASRTYGLAWTCLLRDAGLIAALGAVPLVDTTDH